MDESLLGKLASVTSPAGHEWRGRVAGWHTEPVILIQTSCGLLPLPQTHRIEVLDDEGVHGARFRELVSPRPPYGWRILFREEPYGAKHEVLSLYDDEDTPTEAHGVFHAGVRAAFYDDPGLLSVTAVYEQPRPVARPDDRRDLADRIRRAFRVALSGDREVLAAEMADLDNGQLRALIDTTTRLTAAAQGELDGRPTR